MQIPGPDINDALRRSVVVIPSINGAHLLERALPSLRVPSSLVVVVDQGSTDHTADICRAAGVEVVQLGAPHTYTQACNIGIELARKRGCRFVFLGNNDIVLKTDVARELLEAMLDDNKLGIVAPSQLLIDESKNQRLLAYRVLWDLKEMHFHHDFEPPTGNPRRIESDFCELTFALVRIDAVDAIGLLDNDYGFYHEDADFGFRLRQAGYSCAYVPSAQIEHYVSATFNKGLSDVKRAYSERNKRRFKEKFLHFGIRHDEFKDPDPNSWSIINRNLHSYLRRFGLVDPSRPRLIFSHPGTEPFDYLYTVWETTALPQKWLGYRNSYRALFAASQWNASVLRESGFQNVYCAPLGVETDVYHPWNSAQRLHDGKTFLWFASNQYRKGLEVVLDAWARFHPSRANAHLILLGTNIAGRTGSAPNSIRRWKNFLIHEHRSQGLSVYETIEPLDDPALAAFYCGVDFTICSSRSEGFGFVPAESMACGTPSIFGAFGATREFMFEGSLCFDGARIRADYRDKGFDDVGDWWEPDVDQLKSLLFKACDMDAATYREIVAAGLRVVRSRYTWRSTVMALREGLAKTQEPCLFAANEMPAGVGSTTSAAAPVLRSLTQGARSIGRTAARYNAIARQMEGQPTSEILRGVARRLVRMARDNGAGAAGERRRGILFVGYVEANLGFAESQRNLIAAVAQRGLDFGIYPIAAGVETRLTGPFMADKYDGTNSYDINVIEVAGDQVAVAFGCLGRRKYSRSYNVLRTYWELPNVPEEWRAALMEIDEVWAPNAFVQRAFARALDGPVIIIPPCVSVDGYEIIAQRHPAAEKQRRFEFIFSFDYYSSPYRKNPLGVIAAFRDAFSAENQDVGLLLKSTGAPDLHPAIRQSIQAAVAADPRITIIDKTLSRPEMLALIDRCDCYVSLHRAEGFGLGMAEAMMLGKIVVGTAYSGSADFLTEETGFPVPYRLRAVDAYEYVWTVGQTWAEPIHHAAVAALREAYANRELSTRKAKAGQAYVRKHYGKERVGAAVERRYAEIMRMRGS